MQSNLPPSSTRLENINLEPDGAKLDLDGRPVKIGGETGAPSVAALRAFHQSALADYQARSAPASSPGWFSRLKSWLGNLFSSPPKPSGEPPVLPPSPGRRDPAPADPGHPRLQAAFADKAGVHVLWRAPVEKASRPPVEFNYGLDSELASRLQDCYGQLAKLGYKIVGLEPLHAEPPLLAAADKRAAPAPAPKSPEKKEPTLVVRLQPESGAASPRVSAASAEEAEKTHVLKGPEPLLRAVRAAADAGHPAEDRLTFLRCTLGKGGLKIVDVGLGEGRDHAPARWEEVSQWWGRQAEPAAAASKKAHPALEPDP